MANLKKLRFPSLKTVATRTNLKLLPSQKLTNTQQRLTFRKRGYSNITLEQNDLNNRPALL